MFVDQGIDHGMSLVMSYARGNKGGSANEMKLRLPAAAFRPQLSARRTHRPGAPGNARCSAGSGLGFFSVRNDLFCCHILPAEFFLLRL